MTQAIAQSATQLAVSNGESNWTPLQFDDSTQRNAEKRAKGITREGNLLNRNKLISAVCADYRSHFASIYGRTDRLPSEVFAMVETAVDKFINSKLSEINLTNAISYRRSFFHKPNTCEVVERVTAIAENTLLLKEQHLGINMLINTTEKRLAMLQAKKTPDYEKEKQVKAQIMRLELTRAFIEGEQTKQAKAVKQ